LTRDFFRGVLESLEVCSEEQQRERALRHDTAAETSLDRFAINTRSETLDWTFRIETSCRRDPVPDDAPTTDRITPAPSDARPQRQHGT